MQTPPNCADPLYRTGNIMEEGALLHRRKLDNDKFNSLFLVSIIDLKDTELDEISESP